MKTLTIILFLHICFLPKMLWAQEENRKPERIWLRLASGASLPIKDDNIFISTGLGLFAEPSPKRFFCGVNINYNTVLNLFNETSQDYSIGFDGLMGKNMVSDRFYAGISSGISFITGLNSKQSPVYDSGTFTGYSTKKDYFNVIGFPLDIELGFVLKNNKILGINSVTNFNRKQPFTALRIYLQFGDF